jgi:uncharacterized protein YbaR (Trm112 family)
MISEKLLEILACPRCKTEIALEGEEWLVCQNPECGLRYPIRDEIPIMLLDEAEDPLGVRAKDQQAEAPEPDQTE